AEGRAHRGRNLAGRTSGGSSAFQEEAFQREARAHILLEVSQSVVRALQEARPARLGGRWLVGHAAAQVELPAAEGEKNGVLGAAVGGAPLEVGGVQLGRQGQRDVGRRAESLIQAR